MADISFFSEVDLSDKGKIASEYPAWYNRQMIDELKEELQVAEYGVKMGYVPQTQIASKLANIKKLKDKLAAIEESIPKMDDKSFDSMAKVRKELGKDITSMMFTRSQMERGLADSHEEARRMVTPSIKLTPEASEFAKACNVPISSDGKVSRTGAEKIWKIASRYLGEMSNTENLRKD